MTEPKRWLDDPSALTSAERQVLAADAGFGAPAQAKSELWSSIVATAGTAAVNTSVLSSGTAGTQVATGGATAGHALSLGAVIKLTLVGIGIGTSLATAGHFWAAREKHEPRQVLAAPHQPGASSATAPRAVAGQAASGQDPQEQSPSHVPNILGKTTTVAPVEVAEPVAESAPVPAMGADTRTSETLGSNGRALAQADSKSQRSSPDAREESQLVGSARSMLRAGNPAVALQLIDRATSRFAQGVLIQEREALRVETLAALGRTSEARAHAAAFVAAYPTSPHTMRVKSLLERVTSDSR